MPFAMRILPAFFTLSPFIFWGSTADLTTSSPPYRSTFIANTSTLLTTYPPLSTANISSCTPNCSWHVPSMSHLTWMYIVPTATMVVATVQVIINKDANTTRTTTISEKLPSGVTVSPIPTNVAGTRITSVTDSFGNISTIAFPSGWVEYDATATWSGTLSTSSQCQTGEHAVTITTHPPYPNIEGSVATTIAEDPRGIFYEPFILGEPGSYYFFSAILADELFVQVCSNEEASPPLAAQGTHFLTDTVTSFESGYVQTVAKPATNPSLGAEETKDGGVEKTQIAGPIPIPLPTPHDGQIQAPEPSVGPMFPATASGVDAFVTHTAGLYSGILSEERSILGSNGLPQSYHGGSPSGGADTPSSLKGTGTNTLSSEPSTEAVPSQFTGAANSRFASMWGWIWGFIVLASSMLLAF
ncbi:hypothetical protein BCR34DRAFT_5016 [Clohesyomyces aquaticus]|uniref:Uncharacterized protein n=1 Tax=Clohesyomyces aquaticus TaxID=1231657 RepID=A0A1Y2ABA2_9PLEO|nr:hypothetical protein BCR34DRAFT_5016 [Clohesyomyces aquaticus]